MLIVNPFATATSPAGRDALVNTLSSHFIVDTEHTTHRGHAGELGARATAEGYDAVIVHGGDGSVNEAVNGLLPPPGQDAPHGRIPAVAVIPGGSANVFARSLGIDPDPLKATHQVLGLLDHGTVRRIGLGHAAGRWFLFNTGMGIDAMVVHAMEDKRHAGKAATPARYFWTTVACVLRAPKHPPTFEVTIGNELPIPGVQYGFVSNTRPWTYLGTREIRTNPTTTYDTGLGVFGATSTSVLNTLPLAARLLAQRDPTTRHTVGFDDVERVRFRSAEPLDVQMDGDYIGAHTDLSFGHRPDALTVIAPHPPA